MSRKFVIETVVYNREIVVECFTDCDHLDEKNLLSEVHRKFLKAIENDLLCNDTPKKKKNKNKTSFQAEKIVGSLIAAGELMFMVKWYKKNDISFIAVEQAKKKFPCLVLDYFEKRLHWHPIQE